MQITVLESVAKTIGSLALAYPYLRRLEVAELINDLVTKGTTREVPTSQVIEVLILNRLSLRPVAISKIGAWADTQAIAEVYGIAGESLNDDRIGRASDEIHPHLVDLWAAIVVRGAQAYGVRLDRLHSDVTRLAFEGDYKDVATTTADGQALAPVTYGYTGREDPTRKQVTLSLSVTADGGPPAWYQVANGSATDNRAYLAHLAPVRDHLKLDQPLAVGDSKPITRPNMLGFCRVGARFIGPTGLTAADREVPLSLWEAGRPMLRMDRPAPDEPPAAARYWGVEFADILPDPEEKTTYRLRRLFVQSLDNRGAARHQRAKDLLKGRRPLWTFKQRLSRPAYRDRRLVERKVAEAIAKVGPEVHVTVGDSAYGLDVRWTFDHNQLRVDACFDGMYCLLTNDAEAAADAPAVLRAHKDQSKVERRFRAVQQPPIEVRPIWLHQHQRIESPVFVVMVGSVPVCPDRAGGTPGGRGKRTRLLRLASGHARPPTRDGGAPLRSVCAAERRQTTPPDRRRGGRNPDDDHTQPDSGTNSRPTGGDAPRRVSSPVNHFHPSRGVRNMSLAVFAGGWTLEGAEAICAGSGLAAEAVLGLLAGLVDKSLVVADETGGSVRYRLLETMRQYGGEKLRAAGEEVAIRDRHRTWYAALADEGEPHLRGSDQATWLARLGREHDNLRATLAWCLDGDYDPTNGLLLAWALAWFWRLRGHMSEGRRWLELALARGPTTSVSVQIRALNGTGFLAFAQNDLAVAARLFDESLRLAREANDQWAVAWALHGLGRVAHGQGDYERAASVLNESLATFRSRADIAGSAYALYFLANVARDRGDYARAAAQYAMALDGAREVGDTWCIAWTLIHMGRLTLLQGQIEEAAQLYREGLILSNQIRALWGVSDCLWGLARVATAHGQWERAARLFGADQVLVAQMGTREARDGRVAEDGGGAGVVRAALGAPRFDELVAEGRAMALEQAISYAGVAVAAPVRSGQAIKTRLTRSSAWPLTPREREVTVLIARGLSNREIAAALVITPRTVDTHVKNIFTKLERHSRAQVTAWAAERGLLTSTELR